MKTLLALVMFASSVLASSVFAKDINVEDFSTSLDFAQVRHVKAAQSPNGSWCFHTTVRHKDEGWKHYADAWEVVDLKGNKLGERLLAHPHDSEQPFTRSQCGIRISDGLSKVVVRAKCNKHGFGGQPIVIDLMKSSGTGFSVQKRSQ